MVGFNKDLLAQDIILELLINLDGSKGSLFNLRTPDFHICHRTGCEYFWLEVPLCKMTAPKPNREASAEMFVSNVGSYKARMVGF